MIVVWRIIVALNLFTVVSVVCLTAEEIEAQKSGWNLTPNTQYHIQTDEGPERYFRFQTLNGQYRKEKRLEDGTVIGTEGWLDPLGYLRIKDYIADSQGFRILKSKMVYVGKNRPIEDAVLVSKSVPAQSGILAKPRRPPNPFRERRIEEAIKSNSIESNTIEPHRYDSPVVVPRVRYGPGGRISPSTTTPRPIGLYSSTFDPRPILLDDSYENKISRTNYVETDFRPAYGNDYIFNGNSPSIDIEPPIFESNKDLRTSQSIDGVQILPKSSYGINHYHDRRSTVVEIKTTNATTPTTTTTPGRSGTISRPYRGSINYFSANNNLRKQDSDRTEDSTGSISNRRAQRRSDLNSRYFRPDVTHRNAQYSFPPYDGHHTTSDGFQYYLDTHYHEEEKKPNDDRAVGSFGYVDPFGIRRVVYYKADPRTGFVHKKNNRYVGHNGTPYDPLPLNS